MNAIFLMIVLCAMSSGNLFLQKKFQIQTAESISNFALYNMISAFFACGYFFAANGFEVKVNMLTFIYSAVYALIVCLSLVLGVCMLSRVNISTSSIVGSAGSIIVSSLFGIIYFGEALTFNLLVAILLVIFGAVFSVGSGGYVLHSQDKAHMRLLICVLFFVNSGAANVISKLYAEAPGVCDSVSFFFYTNLILLIVSAVVLIFCMIKQRILPAFMLKSFTAKQILNIAARTALNNISSVITVAILSVMNVSLYTVLISSFGVIQSALMSIVFRERIRLRGWIAVVLVVTAIIILNIHI